MDRSRTDMNRRQRCSNYNNVVEPEYDVVDDPEELLNVRILPARPLNDKTEYADRDLPRSSSAQSLSSLSTGHSDILQRRIHPGKGPTINRELKPSRRKARLERRPAPEPPGDQRSHRSSRSPPGFMSELVNHLPGLSLDEPCRRRGLRTRRADFSPYNKDPQCVDSLSGPQGNQRHSLDLETHVLEKWAQQNLERKPSKHHEWPQTKEDVDQRDFLLKEKPQQTFCDGDWYVGACNRADAEHALHLVNKDGAFLVRDCSINTNSEPLVLAVYHDKKVYNVKIRFLESTSKYALGTRQRSDDMFDSVTDIIRFHSIFPIILISGRNVPGSRYPDNCVLTCPVTKEDVDQLLQ